MELQTNLLAIPAETEEIGGWGAGGGARFLKPTHASRRLCQMYFINFIVDLYSFPP